MPFQHTGLHSAPNYPDESLGPVSFCSSVHIWLTFLSYGGKSWPMHVSCIFTNAVSNSDYVTSNDWMVMYRKRTRSRRTEENTEKPFRLVGAPTKIRTEPLPREYNIDALPLVSTCSYVHIRTHHTSDFSLYLADFHEISYRDPANWKPP